MRYYITRHYDKLGRLTNVKSYTGVYGSGTLYATSSYTYQYDGKISTATDPGNHTYTYTHDFLGRKTQFTRPDSSSVSYSYDDTNNKITFTNGRGYDVAYWRDWLFQVTRVEEEYATGLFAVTTFQYNEIGQLTSLTDAENHTTSYTYSSLFGSTRARYADSEYEEYEYDNVGNVTTFTDAKGNDTVYTYDDIYRLTQIQYEDQSTVDFTYDLNSNRTEMEDDSPSTGDYVEYTYDYWNRLTSETRHISQNTYTVSYQYDVASRLTKITYPDDMDILYSYDDLNRTTEIKRYVDGSNDEILMNSVQYNVESLLTQFDYGNDLQATFSYDSRHRPSTIDVKDGETSFLDLDYTLDNNSNVTQLVNGWRDTDTDWHSETESYNYDGLDRLTSASCTSWSHTYLYDKVGNRTAADGVTYTINTVNEVTALSDGTSFTYDLNGNRTQKTKGTDIWVYTYDYTNKLTKVEKNSVILEEYAYDGGGKRIQLTKDSVTTTYIYSGFSVLYEENTTGTTDYIYGPRGFRAKRTTINGESHTFYYHTDHLGSTRLITDDSKNIVSAATYHPFGESDVEEGSENYLFTGKEKDSTGLYYFSARYYDCDVGRFITRDVQRGRIENPQSLNRFAYCYNNPMSYMDPDGRAPKHVIDGPAIPAQGSPTPPVPPYDGEGNFSIFDSIQFAAGGLWTLVGFITESAAIIIVGLGCMGVIFACEVAKWLLDVANERIFIDPMYEVGFEGYFDVYGTEKPEYCRFIIRRDKYGQILGLEIYDSQENLVGVWTTNQYGQIRSGWMMQDGKWVIFNPETGEWEDAPDGWKPGNPLPGEAPSLGNNTGASCSESGGGGLEGGNNGGDYDIM